MKRTLTFATAVAAGLFAPVLNTLPLAAQAAAGAPSAPTSVTPQATVAKIAVIAFEQAVVATNEGQRAVSDIQKKFEPKKAQIDQLASEVDSLKKQLQALPATTSDEERSNRLKAIDTKEKVLQRDAEDAQTSYQNDIQEAYGKVAQKVGAAAVKYTQDNGFTMLLNVGGSQQAPTPVLWFDPSKTDITQAVINAYNVSSGVAAPPPSAPSAGRRATPPSSTAPKK